MAVSGIKMTVDVDTSTLAKKFGTGKRALNKAIRDGMMAKRQAVEDEVKRRAPKDTLHLTNSLVVKVKGGPAGAAKFLEMIPDIKPGTDASAYWKVREFGPRGGVIRGRKKMSFAFEGSKFFRTNVTAGDVAASPSSYGFDFTMIQGNMVFGVIRKTGKSYEQLYPKAKKRKPQRLRRGKGIPTKGNPNFIPLFVLVDAVRQKAHPYMRPAFEAMAAEVQQSILDHVLNAFGG